MDSGTRKRWLFLGTFVCAANARAQSPLAPILDPLAPRLEVPKLPDRPWIRLEGSGGVLVRSSRGQTPIDRFGEGSVRFYGEQPFRWGSVGLTYGRSQFDGYYDEGVKRGGEGEGDLRSVGLRVAWSLPHHRLLALRWDRDSLDLDFRGRAISDTLPLLGNPAARLNWQDDVLSLEGTAGRWSASAGYVSRAASLDAQGSDGRTLVPADATGSVLMISWRGAAWTLGVLSRSSKGEGSTSILTNAKSRDSAQGFVARHATRYRNGTTLTSGCEFEELNLDLDVYANDARALGVDVPAGTRGRGNVSVASRRHELSFAWAIPQGSRRSLRLSYRHLLLHAALEASAIGRLFLFTYADASGITYPRVQIGLVDVGYSLPAGRAEVEISARQLLPFDVRSEVPGEGGGGGGGGLGGAGRRTEGGWRLGAAITWRF